MSQLSNCCCCISLRTGTLIIGLLYLIGASISFAGLGVAIYYLFFPKFDQYGDYVDDYALYASFFVRGFTLPNKVIAICLIALAALQIIVDIVLIVGAATRRAAYVVPWMVTNIVLLVFNIMGLIAISVIGFISMDKFINVVSIAPLGGAFVYLAVSTYIMMIVSAFYESARKSF